MSEIPAVPEGQSGIRIVSSLDVGDTPVYYSNHVQVTFTPEDFTLHLGWYTTPPFPGPPPGVVDVPVRSLAKVVVPLNLVRGLLRALETSAQNWERNWGELPAHPNPPDVEAPAPTEAQES